jgi:hypothetical protein
MKNSVPISSLKDSVPKVFGIGSFGSVPVFTENTESQVHKSKMLNRHNNAQPGARLLLLARQQQQGCKAALASSNNQVANKKLTNQLMKQWTGDNGRRCDHVGNAGSHDGKTG